MSSPCSKEGCRRKRRRPEVGSAAGAEDDCGCAAPEHGEEDGSSLPQDKTKRRWRPASNPAQEHADNHGSVRDNEGVEEGLDAFLRCAADFDDEMPDEEYPAWIAPEPPAMLTDLHLKRRFFRRSGMESPHSLDILDVFMAAAGRLRNCSPAAMNDFSLKLLLCLSMEPWIARMPGENVKEMLEGCRRYMLGQLGVNGLEAMRTSSGEIKGRLPPRENDASPPVHPLAIYAIEVAEEQEEEARKEAMQKRLLEQGEAQAKTEVTREPREEDVIEIANPPPQPQPPAEPKEAEREEAEKKEDKRKRRRKETCRAAAGSEEQQVPPPLPPRARPPRAKRSGHLLRNPLDDEDNFAETPATPTCAFRDPGKPFRKLRPIQMRDPDSDDDDEVIVIG